MTTPFLSYPFAATGATTAFTLPDKLAEVINVKDYGAIGDGSHDDTDAIQAAFDAAWGQTPGGEGPNSNWLSGRPDLNKPVMFPAGNYIVTDTLKIYGVHGALIKGSGSKSTSITYAGVVPNIYPAGGTKTSIVFTNGLGWSRIQGISFIMTSGNTLADNTVCFNWNWNQAIQPGANTTVFCLIDVGFSGGTYGLLYADPSPVGYGEECDVLNLFGCWIDNCVFGLRDNNANAIGGVFAGGSITNCTDGAGGGVGFLNNKSGLLCPLGILFSGNDIDMQVLSQAHCFVTGCKTTDANFITAINTVISGCTQTSSSTGYFCSSISGYKGVIVDGCTSVSGDLRSGGQFYLRDNSFGNANYLTNTISVYEIKTPGPLTVATLPIVTDRFPEGCIASVSDSSTAGWADSVTAGGSTNHVMLRFNSTNWTVVGK